jgi:hypothetical protein
VIALTIAIKGDEKHPRCRHCTISNRICDYPHPEKLLVDVENERFSFSEDQEWVRIPGYCTYSENVADDQCADVFVSKISASGYLQAVMRK